jgi:uncharacterized repeat protein (TIGR03803 family)
MRSGVTTFNHRNRYMEEGDKMTIERIKQSRTKYGSKWIGVLLPLLLAVPIAAAQQNGELGEANLAPEITQASDLPHPDSKVCCLLHPFWKAPDGNTPESGLVMDAKGVLYGTTYAGGTSTLKGQGVVYSLASLAKGMPQTKETILYSFASKSATDGANPTGNVTLGSDGEIYGTTEFGGTQDQGTVYMLKPPASKGKRWTEEVLYSFGADPINDGANPFNSLLLYKGNLYGTTSIGGNSGCEGTGCGNIFELSPPVPPATEWTETILHQFSGADGALSMSNLILDEKGNLYGTASMGGASESGVVFELEPPKEKGKKWTETVLFSFDDGFNGANPESGLIFDESGALYGTTFNGGPDDIGVVFKLAPPSKAGGKWKETVLYGFTIPERDGFPCFVCGNSGSNPYGNLAMTKKKVLYGATVWGGDYNAGAIFQLSPPASPSGNWTETLLHSFTGGVLQPVGSDNGDGINPYGGILLENGVLYGTVQSGGAFNFGDVFSFTP